MFNPISLIFYEFLILYKWMLLLGAEIALAQIEKTLQLEQERQASIMVFSFPSIPTFINGKGAHWEQIVIDIRISCLFHLMVLPSFKRSNCH
jgi:hypothetical protein